MRLDSAAVIFASVVLSSGSQVLLKRGMIADGIPNAVKTADAAKIALAISTSPPILLGFGCFGLSLVLWLYILSHEPLSSAYPFVALGILVTVLAGSILFAEPISVAKAAGVGLILAGVVLVGISG